MSHNAPYLHRNVLQAEIDLYRSEGIHIYELSYEFFESQLNGDFPNKLLHKIAGLYMPRPGIGCGPKAIGFKDRYNIEDRSIIIKKSLPNYQKFATLLHEKGHDICHESQCKCICNRVLSEIHAWRHELSMLLQLKLWNILKAEIENFRNNSFCTDTVHYKAIEAVKRSALWRRCINAIRNSAYSSHRV